MNGQLQIRKHQNVPQGAPFPQPPTYVDHAASTPGSDTASMQSPTFTTETAERSNTSSSLLGSSEKDQCDLCQVDMAIGSMDEHVASEHGSLLSSICALSTAIQALKKDPKPLTGDSLVTFGQCILDDVAPSDKGEKVFQRALEAHDQVSRLVLRRFPQCKVFMFGSCVAMGSWDGSGDIDLTLVDPVGWDKGDWPPGDEGTLIARLAGICREGGFSHADLEPLRHTRVPVLKHKRPFKLDLSEHTGVYEVVVRFAHEPPKKLHGVIPNYFPKSADGYWRDPTRYIARFKTGLDAFDAYMSHYTAIPLHTLFWASFSKMPEMFGVDFDLTVRAHGIRNSWLLRKYMEQSSVVRAGSVFLKHWSKASAVNNAMRGYLTSYATNILWVYFLLRRKLVRYIDPLHDVEGLASKSPIAPTYIPLISPDDVNSKAFLEHLAATIYDVFCFYAYEFDWENEVVSISRPEPATKASLDWSEDKEVRTGGFRNRLWYRICIEDPFESNLNLGRHASIPKALKIRSQFCRAALLIANGNFKAVLIDNTVNAAVERLQRQFARQMAQADNISTLGALQKAIYETDPDVLAAVESDYQTKQIPALCGCLVSDDNTIRAREPTALVALVGSNCQELIQKTDAEVKAAGHTGLVISALHNEYNLQPLYFSSLVSKRLFSTSKAMKRFDAHFTEIMDLLREADNASHRKLLQQQQQQHGYNNVGLSPMLLPPNCQQPPQYNPSLVGSLVPQFDTRRAQNEAQQLSQQHHEENQRLLFQQQQQRVPMRQAGWSDDKITANFRHQLQHLCTQQQQQMILLQQHHQQQMANIRQQQAKAAVMTPNTLPQPHPPTPINHDHQSPCPIPVDNGSNTNVGNGEAMAHIVSLLKERVPNVDSITVEVILNDARFVAYDSQSKSFVVAQAAKEAPAAKDGMDITSKQMGNCDECKRRDPVYHSVLGGRMKYCERCWVSYLKNSK